MALDNETRDLAKNLIQFMKKKFGYDRHPRVKFLFDKQNALKHLGFTGHYENDKAEIVVYAEGRHPKDVLRSLAHELLHHVQVHEGKFEGQDLSDTSDPNYLVKNDFLKGIEGDAYERGNVAFREWEAGIKEDKRMNERKLSDKETLHEGEEKQVEVNPAITNSNTYIESDRALANAYQSRDEKVYNELLKKFGIKK